MKYKGIKKACIATRKTCSENGYGLVVCIYRYGNEVKFHDDLTYNSWIKFDEENLPDAVYYAITPMTMAEIEEKMEGENL
jgi:hypothetical protein